ncbi:hypothetical protein EJ04DRAFT_516889 [Polyplosphaeria fusca]|uniref:Uncharacterized protein n=1 Tax=Polyplosphaeria fusca TaxID=682080 RepID=A0A9P4QND1_9PLEO|nr:hypothetical protein EJ04DRAFT_516889 [Polyplosphaeria fusca]
MLRCVRLRYETVDAIRERQRRALINCLSLTCPIPIPNPVRRDAVAGCCGLRPLIDEAVPLQIILHPVRVSPIKAHLAAASLGRRAHGPITSSRGPALEQHSRRFPEPEARLCGSKLRQSAPQDRLLSAPGETRIDTRAAVLHSPMPSTVHGCLAARPSRCLFPP